MSVGNVRVGTLRVPFGSSVDRFLSRNARVFRVYRSGVVTTAGTAVVMVVGRAVVVGDAPGFAVFEPPHAPATSASTTATVATVPARFTTRAAPIRRSR